MEADFPEGMVEEIERFLAVQATQERGMDVYPAVFETNAFFPLQRIGEVAAMMQVARTISPTTVMEIGADKGGSLYHWIMCLPTVRNIIACEVRGCPYQHAFSRAFPDVSFLWVERASLPPPRLSVPIDVLFIDGDKGGFLQDFDAYLPMMATPGIVFMHDVQDKGPPRSAFEKVVQRGYRTEVLLNKMDTHHALRRHMRGYKPATPHEAWLRYWKGTSCGVGVVYLD
jgi:hypothetical protein